jgi:YbbR domain-containing protein
MSRRSGRLLLQNSVWFGISLVLAFVVWFAATIQADPIQQTIFRAIPITIAADSDYVITNTPTETALVNVRAQRSVLAALTRDDITLTADVQGRSAGTHIVPLTVRVNRPGIITTDTQPTQITITLERLEAVRKPVVLRVIEPPPADFAYDQPQTNVFQAEVRGASGQVGPVVEVRGDLILGDQRNPLTADIPLVAVDAAGQPVRAVTIVPAVVPASVNIYARPDVRQVTVRPGILFDTLPEGYVFESIRIDPQVVYLTGSPEALNRLGSTVSTTPIDLSGRTGRFEVTVPLELPADTLLLSSDNQIRVQVGIIALVTARQYDNIPVTLIGASPEMQVTLNPPRLDVVLNAPLAVLDGINAEDIQAVVDVNGLLEGNFERPPRILIQQGQVIVNSIQTLPRTVTLTITRGTPAPEPTPPPETTASPP